MRILKANTAVRLVVGPLCDKTTGLAKPSMTVTNMAMNMWHEHDDGSAPTKSIDAVSFTASGGNNDMVELAGGYYDIEITAAQLNITAGRASFCIYDDDVILPYFEEWLVVPANVFDSIMGTDKLDVNLTNLPSIPADWLTASGVKADAVTKIQTGLALEATLTAIKGAGWTDETLAALMTAIEAIGTGSGATPAQIWSYAQRYLSGQTDGLMVIGPVRNDGKIDGIAGDDYYLADGRGMQWSDTAWPDLTGATVNFISGSTTIAMSVVTAGAGEQTVNLDVPRATSAAMKGEFKFIIQATLASTHVVTLLEGEGRFK